MTHIKYPAMHRARFVAGYVLWADLWPAEDCATPEELDGWNTAAMDNEELRLPHRPTPLDAGEAWTRFRRDPSVAEGQAAEDPRFIKIVRLADLMKASMEQRKLTRDAVINEYLSVAADSDLVHEAAAFISLTDFTTR